VVAFQLRLSQLSQFLTEFRNKLPLLPRTTDFLPEDRDFASAAIEQYKQAHAELDTTILNVLQQLEAKKNSLEIPINHLPRFAVFKSYRLVFRRLNGLIKEHNLKVADADGIRDEARLSLCRHYAAEYVKGSQVREKEIRMEEISQRATSGTELKLKIEGKAKEVEALIQQASIGPDLINRNLDQLLPGDNIKAVKLNDTDFEFRRNDQPARQMSDGERTAVSFAYFLGKLHEGVVPLSEIIIVLDDPISSLDSNHVYAVHGIMVS
jgi:wobble nucleotide-excising tRNase